MRKVLAKAPKVASFALKTIKGGEAPERASESCQYSPCR